MCVIFYSDFTGRSNNMPRKTYFSDLWLELPQYKDWFRKKGDITGQCSYYANDIDVPNMGELALKSHAGSEKHRSRSPTEPNNSLSFVGRGKNEKNKEMSANSEKDKRRINLHLPVKKLLMILSLEIMFYLLKSDLP